MSPARRLVFVHGLEGSGQGFKAQYLRRLFPEIHTPDFSGSLQERMAQLDAVLGIETGWKLVGSSFGGLMAALFACRHPQQVTRSILLAPALIWPDFAAALPGPVDVPTVIYHGRHDDVIPLALVQSLAGQVFRNLTFHAVDDDHGLHKTVQAIDWPALVGLDDDG